MSKKAVRHAALIFLIISLFSAFFVFNACNSDNHPHELKKVERKEPTCTEPGLKEGVCSVCGEKATEEIPALGHSFGEWTVVKEATETEEGLKERTCSVCGEKETQVIPKLEKEEPATEDANTPDIPQTSGRSIAYVVSSLAMLSMAAGVSVYAVNKKRKNK